jgi:Fe-S-cluster containining protein
MEAKERTLALVDKVESVFTELDGAIARFQSETGWGCREGCGDCCNNPEVEVTVLEALPHALLLWKTAKAELYSELLAAKRGARCLFYSPQDGDQTKGRCSIYGTRPLLCRMFGFTAQLGKDAKPRLAACKYQKQQAAEVLARIDAELRAERLEAPLFAYWEQRLSELEPSQVLSERLPINQAFVKAIDYLYWRQSELR